MYSQKIVDRLVNLLAPNGYEDVDTVTSKYPRRTLFDGAEVMRVPPSPTGFVHIGTVYAGLVNERIAHQSGGVFILRIEDTDKKREVEGSVEAIEKAFKLFELSYDEGPDRPGLYGPYKQSERGELYLGYAIELLKKGRAYPCFATSEELKALTEEQQEAKVRPGYYGEWAKKLWRDRTEEEIQKALDENKPFVLRFRSEGSHERRIAYTDVFKGKMEVPENDLDVPLIKSDEHRLPTYHLAHVVDDYLMGVTKVFRSDEWLPSTALHIELSEALGNKPFVYGHFAPISVIDKNGGGKRKLSKRKDDEANVQFWIEAGYPIEAVKAYLLGLANSNFEDWYRANPGRSVNDFPVSLEKLAASRAPLLDMKKLEDYAKDYIAGLSQDEFNKQLLDYLSEYDKGFFDRFNKDSEYMNRVFCIERDGDKPRKDLAKWSDAYEQYGYFYDDIFEKDFSSRIKTELEGLDIKVVKSASTAFADAYDHNMTQEEWFDALKNVALSQGFAVDNKDFKENPDKYKGNLADFAKIIRVSLSGKNRTPDLWTVMKVMGPERVRRRLLF